ncbi:UPF0481 protein At3g47200-like isoform X2 [Prosopis cineraria]|uniref:UPF0481 protein At3g47200-like isoform X2 n=1 Tax=Prosopis cineraria TaxID=364024 RepID=UPI00240F1BD4|nr:UPF0481 protein At3g47200-like isoform X2 [Prosopis cineraria]
MEDDEIMIDINAIMTKNRDEDGLSSRLRCIYRVPPMIRHLKRQAYTPQVVSIGPFHHGDKRLKDMERHKEIVFKRFVEKSAMVDLDTLVNFAKQSELKVRASYSENINLSKKDLVKLILVDAAFIIELFRMSYERVPEIFKDAKLSQLNGNIQSLEPHSNIRIKHFTDLLRLFYLPERKSIRHGFKGDRSDFPSYSANELQEAGVKLKKSTSKCLLNLKFSRPVLEIPQIHVDDATETLFRNMIALEQCHYPYESYFVDYIFALDCLVNTNKDVEVLTHKKIIENWLGDADEVAALFNGLGKNIGSSDFSVEYLDTWRRLNKFYQDPCHKRLATLRRDYCNTPWRTVASIAGIILLILTIIQTIFSILQVV